MVDYGHPNPTPRTLGESGSVYIPPQLVGTSYLLNGEVLDEAVGQCLVSDCSVVRLFWASDLLVEGSRYSLVFTDQQTSEDLGTFVADGLARGRPQLLDVSATQTSLSVTFDRPMLHDAVVPGTFDRTSSYDSPDEEMVAALRGGAVRELGADGRTVTFRLWNAVAAGTYLIQVPALYDANGILGEPAVVEVSFADDDNPSLRGVYAGPGGSRAIELTFSEPMDPVTATDTWNYRLVTRVLQTETVTPFPDGTTASCTFIGCTRVTITYPAGVLRACYDDPFPAPAYAVIVSGVLDRAGKGMDPDPARTDLFCVNRDTPS